MELSFTGPLYQYPFFKKKKKKEMNLQNWISVQIESPCSSLNEIREKSLIGPFQSDQRVRMFICL